MKPLQFLGLAVVAIAPGPRGAAREIVVAADGSGDCKSVQAAIDAAPANAATRTVIFVRRGQYPELVVVPPEKQNLTLRGEDRSGTVIAATNNARLNPRRREMFSVAADGFVLENITLHNTTPKGGSQAEAIHVRADRCVLRHCDFKSFQDTLRLEGRVYVRDCYVEGDVDFVWGSGTVYFDRCELKAVNNGYLVQSRNGAGAPGYVFVDCRLTGAPHVERYVLARIEPDRFPNSQVAFVHCAMGPHVSPVAWQLDKVKGADALGPVYHLQFGEYQSTDLAGQPLEVSQRHPVSRQLTADEADRLRDIGRVLGGADHWNPVRE